MFVENPIIHKLPPNTAAQDAELSRRVVLVSRSSTGALFAQGILHVGSVKETGPRRIEEGSSAVCLALQAPYGEYLLLSGGESNIVAIHQHESGTVEAFGPFSTEEEAYDYFPDHSSPHDTSVIVFTVAADFSA